MITDAPGGTRRLTSCRPTTAGTPSERARMAVWYGAAAGVGGEAADARPIELRDD